MLFRIDCMWPLALVLVAAGCTSPGAQPETHPSLSPTTSTTTSTTTAVTTTTPSTTTTAPLTVPAGLPLSGKVVGINAGHNGRNYTDPAFLGHQVFNGRSMANCDTTGTATDGGYTEAQFNFNVATYLRADLQQEGAQVVMTRTTNDGIGPCIDERSAIINNGNAIIAVDIHADGGPAEGRGFAILLPVSSGTNDGVIGSSRTFGEILRDAFTRFTAMPTSDYDGVNGFAPRNDLAGLNFAKQPKVLIECGNMRNTTDAQLLSSETFQRDAAMAMARAITNYVRRFN